MTLKVSGLREVRAGQIILHPTSVAFGSQDRVGLVGSSGSGKSTLGHALIDDLRAQGHRVAHVPQSPDEALDPLRSMAFHWREAERGQGLSPGTVDRDSMFKALRINEGDMRPRPWGWSRGMQQRFVIAMALIGEPELLVLDEPTSALDPIVAGATMDLLDQHLAGSATASLLITHDLGLAARRVDRLMVMEAGHIVEQGSTNILLQAPISKAAKVLTAHRSWTHA